MTTRSERLNRLAVASPCPESLKEDEGTRFCPRCQKHVYDLAAMEAREIEALIEATQGRFCARITRDRFGLLVTRELEAPPFRLPATLSSRRASPVVAAVVTAVVGLTGAGWAETPVSPPAAVAPAAPDPAHPAGPGGAVLGGQVVDEKGFPLPGATVLLRHPEEGWKLIAITDVQGRFQLRDIPSGVYHVEAELEGFDFKAMPRLALGPEGRQITFPGTPSAYYVTVTTGEVWMPVALPLDTVVRESHVMVAGTVVSSVTLRELGPVVREVRTEIRITSVLKGKPRGETIQVDHYAIPGESESFLPGDIILALVDPLGPHGRPDSLVYVSADPLKALQSLPADPRLPPELGTGEAGWRAMSYLARATNNDALQDLVTRALAKVETARRQIDCSDQGEAGEKRLRAQIKVIEKDLRQRFVQVLSGGG